VGNPPFSIVKNGVETPPVHYKVIQKDKPMSQNLGVLRSFVDASVDVIKKNVDMSKEPVPGGDVPWGENAFFLRFTGGYGMHAGHLPVLFALRHGLHPMPRTMAEHFFTGRRRHFGRVTE